MRKFNKRNIHKIIDLLDENYVDCGEKSRYDYIEKVVTTSFTYKYIVDYLFWREGFYAVNFAISLKREYFAYRGDPIVFIIYERSLIELNNTISQLGKNLKQLHIYTDIK